MRPLDVGLRPPMVRDLPYPGPVGPSMHIRAAAHLTAQTTMDMRERQPRATLRYEHRYGQHGISKSLLDAPCSRCVFCLLNARIDLQ